MFWLMLYALAVSDAIAILAVFEIRKKIEIWLEKHWPRMAKLASCEFCQMFWLCGFLSLWGFNPPFAVKWIVLWLAMHRLAMLVNEFCERYLNRAPLSVFATIDKHEQKAE